MPYEPTTNFKDSNGVDLGKKLVTKDYLLEVYGTILENSPASGLVVTPELWVWGLGAAGRLGNSSSAASNTPITTFAGGTNWKQVSMTNQSGSAIKTDGTLWTWGYNAQGQLGVNDGDVSRLTPVTTFAGGTTWKQVAQAYHHTAAVKTDGTLWTWGRNDAGQLGDFSTTQRSIPVTTFAGGTDWKQVTAEFQTTSAIKTDGTLWGWGSLTGSPNTAARSTPVTTFAGGNNWKQVSTGYAHKAAIKTDGSLWIWGRNVEGQLGTNDVASRATPVTTFVGGNNWKQVSAGYRHTAAIKTDGTLWTWGHNYQGGLGDFTIINRSTPVTTFSGGNNWKSVACGKGSTAAIKTDGSLWTWGRGNAGSLGAGSASQRSTPITTFAGGNNWKQVTINDTTAGAIQTIDYI